MMAVKQGQADIHQHQMQLLSDIKTVSTSHKKVLDCHYLKAIVPAFLNHLTDDWISSSTSKILCMLSQLLASNIIPKK